MFLEPMAWLKVKGTRSDSTSVYEVLSAWSKIKTASEEDVVVDVSLGYH